MRIVAGLNLRNLHPQVWVPGNEYHLPKLKAVMVSYADIVQSSTFKRKAETNGLRAALSVPDGIDVFLDNGSFAFARQGIEVDHKLYKDFVEACDPDWKPVAQDYIPAPSMTIEEQRHCMTRTMAVNRAFDNDGYVPVVHICSVLREYIEGIETSEKLSRKSHLAIGGIVPQLLRVKNSSAYSDVVDSLRQLRQRFKDHALHVFGVGGTATLHIAKLLGINSVDSSGWRNRAARGMIQLPGTGERVVAELGSWRGRRLSASEVKLLSACYCPACISNGMEGLKASGKKGFCNRATHNLHVLLEEAEWLDAQVQADTYPENYGLRLDNTVYKPLIDALAGRPKSAADLPEPTNSSLTPLSTTIE